MKNLFLILWIFTITIFHFVAVNSCNAKVTSGRAISLKVLEKNLEECVPNGDCKEEYLQLYGINEILGFVIDEKNNDLILFGKMDDSLPPLYLDDFVVALRNEWKLYARKEGNTYYYSPPGCTIDPDPSVLEELQQMNGHIFNNSEPSKAHKHLEQWHSVCKQPQKVGVFGVPFNSHFSKVMVDADYYMKRIVNGSVNLDIGRFTSLSDLNLDIAKDDLTNGRPISIPLQTMNRFWFYPGNNSYKEDKGIILIKESKVKLLTEEEFLTKEGKVSGSGRSNPLAKQFADKFTEKYDQIANAKPIYHELEGLFRFVSLVKAIKSKEALSKAGIKLEYLLNQFQLKHRNVELELPGISNVKELQHRTDFSNSYNITYLWLPSCGGVSIDTKTKKESFAWNRTGELTRLRSIILAARPSLNSPFWDFPRRRKEGGSGNTWSSSPIFIKLHGKDRNGRWLFEVGDDYYYNLNDAGLRKYVEDRQRSGRGSFIITNIRNIDKEGEFKDAYKRGGDTGTFLRKLCQYGANAAISSNHRKASEKMKKEYPSLIKNGKPDLVVLDGLPAKRFNKIRSELNNYSKTGITIKDINESDYIVKEENLVVIVAPFSWQLLENIEEKSRNNFFKGKMVALVVCGPKESSANKIRYLQAIDIINKSGGRAVYSFEDTIWETECTLLFKNLSEIIDDEINSSGKSKMNLSEAFDKAVEKTKERNLLENKRFDVRRTKKYKNFIANFINHNKK